MSVGHTHEWHGTSVIFALIGKVRPLLAGQL